MTEGSEEVSLTAKTNKASFVLAFLFYAPNELNLPPVHLQEGINNKHGLLVYFLFGIDDGNPV